ncbi:MAG: leucine-rich repeat domain-containing protein, partial [Lachnospiraceae bacterium]|nr:leucine-rich repeat domain-containing protein [Lachnospiraceae bacterium]
MREDSYGFITDDAVDKREKPKKQSHKKLNITHVVYMLIGVALLAAVLLVVYIWKSGEPGVLDGDVRIDEKNFPDETFREKVRFFFDTNEDGFLSKEERNIIKDLDLNYDYSPRITESIELKDTSEWEFYSRLKGRGVIRSLKGIEFFENLEKLDCSHNELTELDVSKNKNLTTLYCDANLLTELDLHANRDLIYLDCRYNQLTELDVRDNRALKDLQCDHNQLTTLNVSENRELGFLHCTHNQLVDINVSANPKIYNLYCGYNNLSAINVHQLPSLAVLECKYNKLATLDISKNPELSDLVCDHNPIKELDVSRNPSMSTLICNYTDIS